MERFYIQEYQFSNNHDRLVVQLPTTGDGAANDYENAYMRSMIESQLVIYDAETLERITTSQRYRGPNTPANIRWSATSEELYFTNGSNQEPRLVFWNLRDDTETTTPFLYYGFDIALDGSMLAAWGELRRSTLPDHDNYVRHESNQIALYSLPELTLIRTIRVPGIAQVWRVEWHPDGQSLYVGGFGNNTISQIDLVGEQMSILDMTRVYDLALNQNGTLIAVEEFPSTLVIFDLPRECELMRVRLLPDLMAELSWSRTTDQLLFRRLQDMERRTLLTSVPVAPDSPCMSNVVGKTE